MINTTALEALGDNWKLIKANSRVTSQEQISQIKQKAGNNIVDGKLDSAINSLEAIDTTAVDAISKFSADNSFQYLGSIGQIYAKLGYDKYARIILADGTISANNGDTSTTYSDKMPAWIRSNCLPSIQEYAVRGQIRNYNFLMFVDRVTVSYGGTVKRGMVNNDAPHYSYNGIIVVELNKIFPQIVLDSNKNDKWFMKTRSAAIDSSQKINLEANFSEYYDFYAPKGINANSLSILAPNFMQMLIDSSASFDVELYGDKLYMTTNDPLFTVSVMDDAISALDEQLKYMHRLEDSWSYQPIVEPFDKLKQTRIVNLYSVKIGNYRLGLLQLILIIFVLLAVLINVA